MVHLIDQAVLGQTRPPFAGRLERDRELNVIERYNIGPIIGAAHLRDGLRDLRRPGNLRAQFVGNVCRGLKRNILREGGADPQVPLFQGRHELSPYEGEEYAGLQPGMPGPRST